MVALSSMALTSFLGARAPAGTDVPTVLEAVRPPTTRAA